MTKTISIKQARERKAGTFLWVPEQSHLEYVYEPGKIQMIALTDVWDNAAADPYSKALLTDEYETHTRFVAIGSRHPLHSHCMMLWGKAMMLGHPLATCAELEVFND